jgi:hypothetical protein
MQSSRSALSTPRFGRRRIAEAAPAKAAVTSSLGQDVKLFATTFAAGFLFVAVLIG